MADTTQRVQRWRQRLKDEGKEALTIYLAHDEKRRLDDLAHTRRCSPSAIVQQALAAFHPGSPTGLPGPDTSQLRVLIQEEIAHMVLHRLLPQDTPRVVGAPDVSVTATFPSVPETTVTLPSPAAPPSTLDVQPQGTLADSGRQMSADPAPVEELLFAPDASEGVPDVLVDPPGVETLSSAEGQAAVLDMLAFDYDPTKFVLGKLCPGEHEYRQTGQTLRTIKDRRCYACENAQYRAQHPPARDYDPAKFHLGS